jgi:hypothetical protein
MKKISLLSFIIIITGIVIYLLFFKEPVFHAKGGYLTNINDKGVIPEGYDPVAYFTDNKLPITSFPQRHKNAKLFFPVIFVPLWLKSQFMCNITTVMID